jgi:hypothetical protein
MWSISIVLEPPWLEQGVLKKSIKKLRLIINNKIKLQLYDMYIRTFFSIKTNFSSLVRALLISSVYFY